MTSGQRRCWVVLGVAASVLLVVGQRSASAAAFYGYALADRFELPSGAGPFDTLPDGRIITLVGADVFVETAVGMRSFSFLGTLPDADIASFGAAFIRVSPDGSQIAVGNNGGSALSAAVERRLTVERGERLGKGTHAVPGARRLRMLVARRHAAPLLATAGSGFQVGVFALSDLSGQWFSAAHFDAEWIDDRHLAVTAGDFVNPSVVTALDTQSPMPLSPENPVVIENIGGGSGGIAFDADGNLYTGNGFATSGPSGTGAVKVFSNSAWTGVLSGGVALDFESEGALIVDILSASPLDFDNEGNLLVGGGDFFGSGEGDFAAIVHASAVADARNGSGPADVDDPTEVRRIDPDAENTSNFYSVAFNSATSELYVRDGTIHVYRDLMGVPAASSWGVLILSIAFMTAGTLVARERFAA